MKIKYNIKEWSEDPRTLKKGDYVTTTEKHSVGLLSQVWKFERWVKSLERFKILVGGSETDFTMERLECIKKVHPDNLKNYKINE